MDESASVAAITSICRSALSFVKLSLCSAFRGYLTLTSITRHRSPWIDIGNHINAHHHTPTRIRPDLTSLGLVFLIIDSHATSSLAFLAFEWGIADTCKEQNRHLANSPGRIRDVVCAYIGLIPCREPLGLEFLGLSIIYVSRHPPSDCELADLESI